MSKISDDRHNQGKGELNSLNFPEDKVYREGEGIGERI